MGWVGLLPRDSHLHSENFPLDVGLFCQSERQQTLWGCLSMAPERKGRGHPSVCLTFEALMAVPGQWHIGAQAPMGVSRAHGYRGAHPPQGESPTWGGDRRHLLLGPEGTGLVGVHTDRPTEPVWLATSPVAHHHCD